MVPLHGHYTMYAVHYGAEYPGSYGGDLCFDPSRNATRWCSFGCCGEGDTECCHANLVLLVGVSVASLVLVTCITGICCCCCLRFRRAETKATPPQLLSLHQPPPPYDPSPDGAASGRSDVHGDRSTAVPLPQLYPTQNYPPGCYAPPAYSDVQPASSYSSSFVSSSSCQAYSIPLPPPPYCPESTGHENKAFKESV